MIKQSALRSGQDFDFGCLGGVDQFILANFLEISLIIEPEDLLIINRIVIRNECVGNIQNDRAIGAIAEGGDIGARGVVFKIANRFAFEIVALEKLDAATGCETVHTKLVVVGVVHCGGGVAHSHESFIAIVLASCCDEGERVVGVGDWRGLDDFFAQVRAAIHLHEVLGDLVAACCSAEDLDLRMRAIGVILVIDEAIVPDKAGRRGHKKRYGIIRVG